jgi:hypothetical protein
MIHAILSISLEVSAMFSPFRTFLNSLMLISLDAPHLALNALKIDFYVVFNRFFSFSIGSCTAMMLMIESDFLF